MLAEFAGYSNASADSQQRTAIGALELADDRDEGRLPR
jgi:hypothetical protein